MEHLRHETFTKVITLQLYYSVSFGVNFKYNCTNHSIIAADGESGAWVTK